MHYTKYLLVALCGIVMASCSSYKEIKIEKVTAVSVREFSGSTALVDLTLLVDNPTSHNVKMSKLNLDILRKESQFAHIESIEKVAIPARTKEERTLKLEIRIANILTSGMVLMSKKLNPDDFTANGYIKVSSFPFSKKIKVENQKLGQVVKGLDSIVGKSNSSNR